VISDQRRLGEGQSVKFRVVVHGLERDAFAVRWHGDLYAYVNACRHQSLPLDFGDGVFFDDDFDALVCVQHGARYEPRSGVCVSGPCEGGRLTALPLEVRDGAVWCVMRATETGS
jgi:nitrite reductase/ring-hydroxylating ferredoxin subunit